MPPHESTRQDRSRIPAIFALIGATVVFLAAGAGSALARPLSFEYPVSCAGLDHTSVNIRSSLAGSSEVHWDFEYSTAKGGPWMAVPGGNGTITQAEAEQADAHNLSVEVHAELPGLTPETTYYVLATATTPIGEAASSGPVGCETVPLHASVYNEHPGNITATSAQVTFGVRPNVPFPASWRYEVAPAEGGHAPAENSPAWVIAPGGAGQFSKAEAEAYLAEVKASGQGLVAALTTSATLTALKPGTAYDVRMVVENEAEFPEGSGKMVHEEATSKPEGFATSGPPAVSTFATHSFAGESFRLLGSVAPNNAGLNEIQTVTIGGSPTGGTFTLTSGGQADAATGTGKVTAGSTTVSGVLTTTGKFATGEPIAGQGIPAGTTIAQAGYGNDEEGGRPRIILSQPATTSGSAVTLTAGLLRLPPDATSTEVRTALNDLTNITSSEASGEGVTVTGPSGGPYSVEFIDGRSSSPQPLVTADASGLTPSGTVTVTVAQTGFSYETHYHFEYVSQKAFGEDGGWAAATSTPEQLVADTSTHIVGEDLPALQPGETYRYRLLATNTTPGDPVVEGSEQSLTVPAAVEEPASAVCDNESFRTGLGAHLPDCRAYEQVTPVDKEGAQEAIHYRTTVEAGALVGADGDHVMFAAPQTNWGAGPSAGQSPYFFTRTSSGWQMTAAATQPETGVNRTIPELFSPALTSFAFESWWKTSNTSESKDSEFKLGAPGGPYQTVATVPLNQVGSLKSGGWVAASEDLAKLILQVEDHTLISKHPTGTSSGFDLYEYSGGQLRQANVTTAGATIGTCGARIVKGRAESGTTGVSSRHAVSTDGTRVFFEAVPGSDCSEATNLYMRVDGGEEDAETVDIGAYHFAAANPQGSEVLLEKQNGGMREYFLYETGSATITAVSAEENGAGVFVSEQLGAIYFTSRERLTPEASPTVGESAAIYRYDISTKTLRFVVQAVEATSGLADGPSPDGRYYYFEAKGVPGLFEAQSSGEPQVYRYDSTADVVECISCASSFDPEPKLGAHFGGYGTDAEVFTEAAQGVPSPLSFSANGDYAFFDTPAALVPQDVDGEVSPGGATATSASSDVYEWRRYGLNGCVHLQGCVSLISSGRGGYLVALLGAADEGRDVFFTDFSQLLPRDNDSAGDVYDARIGGGFPEPSAPVECEGDACSTPFAAPGGVTPASSTFHGAGDLLAGTFPEGKPKPKGKTKKAKPKERTKKKQSKHRKSRTKAVRKASKRQHRRGR